MSYPIHVQKVSLDHHGGTKSYHLVILSNGDGKAVVINRWGKTGAFGEIKADTYDTLSAAQKAYDKKYREKTGRGYRQVKSDDTAASNLAELRNFLTIAVFSKMGAAAIAHLDGSADTSGMREADAPRLDEDGKLNGVDTRRKANLEEQIKARHAEEAAASAAELRANPNFGRF